MNAYERAKATRLLGGPMRIESTIEKGLRGTANFDDERTVAIYWDDGKGMTRLLTREFWGEFWGGKIIMEGALGQAAR